MTRSMQIRFSAAKFTASLFLIYIALRLFRAERLIAYMPPSGVCAAPDNVAKRFAAGIRIAAANVPFATCLPQALLARYLLGRRGYQATIHIGVKDIGGDYTAHAWTMSGTNIISGGPEASVAEFKPITVFG